MSRHIIERCRTSNLFTLPESKLALKHLLHLIVAEVITAPICEPRSLTITGAAGEDRLRVHGIPRYALPERSATTGAATQVPFVS